MKVALVHDYLGEFGGGERVLEALSEIWPKAPIYTAFYRKEAAYERFKNRKIITSWAQKVPFFNTKLHSPLRFLAPFIWNSFARQLADFDVVITSASWYVTKGVIRESKSQRVKESKTIEICYCHTPPRYLYGYPTSVEWQKYWPVRVYALLVNHFMRVYDFEAAQRVDWFIANSENVRQRIKKFYRRDAVVIYPPVDLNRNTTKAKRLKPEKALDVSRSTLNGYFLVVSRIVGGKGLQLAVEVANKMGFKLKVVGKPAGYATEYQKITKIAKDNVEFLGYVEDSELAELYSGARAFLALAEDEDFGITPVEAMLAGVPVIAFNGGGYRETVIQGKTGLFFDPATAGSLTMAINTFLAMEKKGQWDHDFIRRHAQKFSKERFKSEIKAFVESKVE